MTTCIITGCLDTATKQTTVQFAGNDTKTELNLCDFHHEQIQARPPSLSIGRDLDSIEARVQRVRTEWRRAHPQVGDHR